LNSSRVPSPPDRIRRPRPKYRLADTTGDHSHPKWGQSAAGHLGGEVREGYADVGDQRLHYMEGADRSADGNAFTISCRHQGDVYGCLRGSEWLSARPASYSVTFRRPAATSASSMPLGPSWERSGALALDHAGKGAVLSVGPVAAEHSPGSDSGRWPPGQFRPAPCGGVASACFRRKRPLFQGDPRRRLYRRAVK
jgi:hypothetical protein